MTTSTRVLGGVLLVVCVAASAEAGQQSPAGEGPTRPASPASAAVTPVRVDLLVDRVWVAEGSGAVPPGALYVFLSDNVLVTSSPGTSTTVGTWAEDVSGLVVTEKGISAKVDVLELTPVRLRLRINAKTPADISFVPAVRAPTSSPPQVTGESTAAAAAPATVQAIVPVGSPYRCGGDALRVAFEGDSAYITWPDGTTAVLREVKTADATPSRRTFSDGQLRVVEDTSESYTRVLFARAGFRPRPCSQTR